MLPARKNRFIQWWFRGYVRHYLKRSFHRVFLHGELPTSPAGPLLVCVNHSSWWDTLLAFWLSSDLLGWDAYGPMDERQLRRYPILRGIGVFGVDRESLGGAREFLSYGKTLLEGQPRAIWMTAQGAMVSNEIRPVRLYSGISRLAQAVRSCSVTTVALDFEFWDEKRPEVFISFAPVRAVEVENAAQGRALLQALTYQLEQQMDELAALRRRRDPACFRVALSTSGGVSPMYDTLRRYRAQLRGEHWEAEHGAVSTPPLWGPAAAANPAPAAERSE